LNELDIPYKFFAMKHKGAIRDRENHIWYHDRQTADDFENRFSGSPEVTGFGGGGTVTCCAIQIASYLGFDPIILIGCDASYSVPSSVIQAGPDQFGDGVKLNLESTQDDDPNHFDPSYFGKGKRWHSPNAAEMHVGFEKTYRLMSRLGLTLVNATVGGALDSVPRVDYERLFETKGSRPPHPRIGIDLTHETAAKQHGMRNSLMATLRNTALMGTDIEFVAFRGADERYDYYDGLGSVRNFTVLTEGDRGFEEAATSLDALLSPFNDLSTSLPIGSDTKRIAYVNDLIPLNHSGFPETTRSRYEETVEGADAIVCLSDATREELSDRFGIDEQDCFTAPPAIDEDLTVTPVSEDFELVSEEEIAAVRRKVGVRDTYLVYPAAFRPHKNHERLFEAMRYTYTMLQLVLTTGESHDHPATRRIQAEIDSRNMSHRILVAGHLSAQDYRALLKGALGLVFPSLEEGFGIPVAEAQAMRVPVIASRRHSLAEVADGSLEIDPEDHMDIADKITQLISDDELRAEVAEQGWLNSRRFTRELGAHGLIAAVNHVLQLRETEAGEAGGVDSLQAPVDRR